MFSGESALLTALNCEYAENDADELGVFGVRIDRLCRLVATFLSSSSRFRRTKKLYVTTKAALGGGSGVAGT